MQEAAGQERRPSRRRLWAAVGVSVLLVTAAVSAGLWWHEYRTSPRAAIAETAVAAVTKDADAVVRHIDTSAVADAAVDDLMAIEDSALVERYLSRRHDSEERKRRLRALIDEEINEHVSAGDLPKRVPLNATTVNSLIARGYANSAVKTIKTRGDTAQVTVEVPYRGEDVEVTLRMELRDGVWKVTRVENLAELLERAER